MKRLGTLALWAGASIVALGCAHEAPGPAAGGPRAPTSAAASVPASAVVAVAVDPASTFWQGRTDLIQPPPSPRPAELDLPRVERWREANGLDIVAVPRQGLPIISFSVAIKAGGYDESKGRNEGAAHFTAAMLRKGTKTRGAEQIADAIDRVGGSLDAAAGMEGSTVDCSALAKDVALCLNLLAELLLRPTFPAAEMPEIRDQMLAGIAARADDPHLLAAEHFDNRLFGEDHPDGWVLSAEDVRGITRETLRTFWRTFYRPNNSILAVAGDFDVEVMKAAIAHALGGWERGAIPARPVFQVPARHSARVTVVDKPDLSQATLMFGHVGVRHGDVDWYAVTLVNYVLGGSDFSSRLMTEVRSKRGLTYGIGSSFGSSLYQGAFRISATTRNETAGDALAVTVAELRKMKAAGPTAGELAKAKGYYAGSIPFELESVAGLAHGLVAAELHDLGPGYVRRLSVRLDAVDVAAARQAAAARLAPDDLTVVVVGRASVIEPQLRKVGLTFDTVDYRAPIGAAPAAVATPDAPSGGGVAPSR